MKYSEICERVYGEDKLLSDLGLSNSERKVWKIITDLSDRRGLRQEWDQIDEEIKDEIFQEWVKFVSYEYTK